MLSCISKRLGLLSLLLVFGAPATPALARDDPPLSTNCERADFLREVTAESQGRIVITDYIKNMAQQLCDSRPGAKPPPLRHIGDTYTVRPENPCPDDDQHAACIADFVEKAMFFRNRSQDCRDQFSANAKAGKPEVTCPVVTNTPTAPSGTACARADQLNFTKVYIYGPVLELADRRCAEKSALEDTVAAPARNTPLPEHPCTDPAVGTDDRTQTLCVADWVGYTRYLEDHPDCLNAANNDLPKVTPGVPPDLSALCQDTSLADQVRGTDLWRDITRPWENLKGWGLFILICAGAVWIWSSLFGGRRSSGSDPDEPYQGPGPGGENWKR